MDKVVSIVLYEVANLAWIDSGAISVSYGQGFDGEDSEIIKSFSKDDCDKVKNWDESKAALIHRDASEGTASLFSAADGTGLKD